MELRLLYVEGCPHWAVAEGRLRYALHSKLEADPVRHRHILTEPGIGYRLVE